MLSIHILPVLALLAALPQEQGAPAPVAWELRLAGTPGGRTSPEVRNGNRPGAAVPQVLRLEAGFRF